MFETDTRLPVQETPAGLWEATRLDVLAIPEKQRQAYAFTLLAETVTSTALRYTPGQLAAIVGGLREGIDGPSVTDWERKVLKAVAEGLVTFSCGPGAGRADYVLGRETTSRQDVTRTIRKLQKRGLVAHVPASLAIRSVDSYVVEPAL